MVLGDEAEARSSLTEWSLILNETKSKVIGYEKGEAGWRTLRRDQRG